MSLQMHVQEAFEKMNEGKTKVEKKTKKLKPKDLINKAGVDYDGEKGKIIAAEYVKDYKKLSKYDNSGWMSEEAFEEYGFEKNDILVAFDSKFGTDVFLFESGGVELDENVDESKKKRIVTLVEAKTKKNEGTKREYKKYFEKKLKAAGYDSIGDIPADKKDDFFADVDKDWKADNEGSNEGRFCRETGKFISEAVESTANIVLEKKDDKTRFFTSKELKEASKFVNSKLKDLGYNGLENVPDDERDELVKKIGKEWDEIKKEMKTEAKSDKIAQSFADDYKNVLKELKKGGIKADVADEKQGLISISAKDADKANKILKKINAFDNEYNFTKNVEVVESATDVEESVEEIAEAKKLTEKDLKEGESYIVKKGDDEAYFEFKGKKDDKLCFDNSGKEIKIDPKDVAKYVSEGKDCDDVKENDDKETDSKDDKEEKNEATDWGTKTISSENDLIKLVAKLAKGSKELLAKVKTAIKENKFEAPSTVYEHVEAVRNEATDWGTKTISSENDLIKLIEKTAKSMKGFRKKLKKALK